MAYSKSEVALLVVVLVFSASLVFFGVSMSKVYFSVPVFACHYGVWDTAVRDYLTGNDPHNMPNNTHYIRRGDDFECRAVQGNFSPIELCNTAVPGYEYEWVSYDGSRMYSKKDMAEYIT